MPEPAIPAPESPGTPASDGPDGLDGPQKVSLESEAPASDGSDGSDGPQKVSLGDVLDQVRGFITDYLVLPSPAAAVAMSLWIVHTWVYDRFDTSPRLCIKSAEKGSGKTRALEILELLCRAAVRSGDLTSAVLFRMIERDSPTVLLDEFDIALRPGNEAGESVRAVVNVGYRRGNKVWRTTGKNYEPTAFETYACVALAGIGDPPDTILDRSVAIPIRKRKRSELVRRWRFTVAQERAEPIRAALEAWSRTSWDPDLPEDDEDIQDRLADVWEPLLCLAAMAGEDWHRQARDAVHVLSETRDALSTEVQLLTDLRAEWPAGREFWATKELLATLQLLEEAPWGSEKRFGEGGLDPHQLARHLRPYGIRPGHDKAGTVRGYRRSEFLDPWERYCPEDLIGDTSGTPSSPSEASTYTYRSEGTSPRDTFRSPSNPSEASDTGPGRSRTERPSEPAALGLEAVAPLFRSNGS